MAKFVCWVFGEDEEDATEFSTSYGDEAAVEYAEQQECDSDSYREERKIMVKSEDGTRRLYTVFAESVRQYHAYEE
jgi:hypothetical protein